jgi:hypothetical protein
MLAVVEQPRRAGDTAATRTFTCHHCHRYLGRILGRTLHEPNGNKSTLPVVRRCPDCGKRCVKMQ